MRLIAFILAAAVLGSGCSSMFPNRTLRHYDSAYSQAYMAKNSSTLGLIKASNNELVVGATIDLLDPPNIWEVLTSKEGAAEAILSDAIISSAWVGAGYFLDKEYGALGGILAGEDDKKSEPPPPETKVNALDGGKITIRNTTEGFSSGGITSRGEGSEIVIEHYVPEE